MARKGAGRLNERGGDDAGADTDRERRPREPFEPERWERVEATGTEAERAGNRNRATTGRRGPNGTARRPARPASRGSAGDLAREELLKALGPASATRSNERLREAAQAFERERFAEARAILRPLAERAPSASAVRELLGLTYYRLGRWKEAAKELEAFTAASRSTEQHPVLADCYRALRKWDRVDGLWEELRAASPAPDLVAEGRIVAAGALADRGELRRAMALLDKAPRPGARVHQHHLRTAYALADLSERSGDVARARELFRWLIRQDAGFADAAERAGALG